MENTVTLADSVQKLTLTGDEAIIAIDGRNIKIPLSSLKNYLDIESFGVVVPTKVQSLNLGAPEEPRVYFGGAGNYVLNGVVTLVDDDINMFFWDKENWNVLGIPINIVDYMKALNSHISWGVGDEEGNVVMYIDDDGKAHMRLHEDSYPIKERLSETFDFAVSDNEGNVIFGVDKEGVVHPNPTIASEVNVIQNDAIRLETITQPSDISKDGIWNQWIEPYAVVDRDGTLWVASVGYRGNLYVTKRTTDGITQRKKIGSLLQTSAAYTSDDHNCPAILLDDREGAPFPIMIFQCDHNTHPMRFWSFDSKDMNEWDVNTTRKVDNINVAYTQVFRHGDEVYVFSRLPEMPRYWRVAYSSDNGNTWNSKALFSTPTTWLYMLCRLKDDKSGLNIAMHTHPLNSTDQSIYFMEMDFDSGSIYNPSKKGIPIIEDVRQAIIDSEFEIIDPFVGSLKVYEAQGLEITRLWDVSRDSTGSASIVFNSMPSKDRNMEVFNESTYNVVNFSLTTGVILKSLILSPAGVPIENPKGGNMYFAGAAMLSNNKCVLMKWSSNSQINDGDDVTDDNGITECYTVNFNNVNNITYRMFARSDLKVIRPFVTGDYMLANECLYFRNYNDFYSNTLINEIKIIDK